MMNDSRKTEVKHYSSDGNVLRGFSLRLRDAIGGRSTLSFANECGFSDSLVRKYLKGSLPGLDKAVTLAEVAGVSLEWLATGRGPAPDSESKTYETLDLTALEQVIALISQAEHAHGAQLSPKATARTIAMLYDWAVNNDIPLTQKVVNDVVAAALDRNL